MRYARKKDNTLHSSTSDPDSIPTDSGNPLPISTHDIPTEMHDLDLSIAVRKGVRSCTQYPISNFVSYDSLSPSYRTFLSSLNSISIPHGLKKAIYDPKWKNAMVEEMKALAKNGT